MPVSLETLEERLLYFAYGANMSSRAFVERRGMQPRRSARAKLEGYQLRFNQPGIPIVEPAFANIAEAKGESVEGVIYDISKDEMKRLYRAEGGGAYDVIRIRIADVSGIEDAYAFRAKTTREGLLPSKRYVTLIIAGAKEYGLSAEWIRMLEQQPHVDHPVLRALSKPIMWTLSKLFALGLGAKG